MIRTSSGARTGALSDIILNDPVPRFGLLTEGRMKAKAFMIMPRRLSCIDKWDWIGASLEPDAPEWKAQNHRSSEALLDGLKPYNIDREGIFVFRGNDSCRERLVQYTWSRQLKWKEFPIVQDPKYALKDFCLPYRFCDDRFPKPSYIRSPQIRDEVLTSLEEADLIIIDHPHPSSSDLAEVGHLASLRNTPPSAILHFDGLSLSEISSDVVAAAVRAWSAHDRFVWSHMLNARVLGTRALKAVYSHPSTSERRARHTMDWISKLSLTSDLLWTPTAIQSLFHVSKLTGLPSTANPPAPTLNDRDLWETDLLVGSGLAEKKGEDLFRWKWAGSGRYPVYQGPYQRIYPTFEFDGPPRLPSHPRLYKGEVLSNVGDEDHVVSALRLADLITHGKNNLVVTDEGKRYLDFLGKDLCDPDVLLRWRKPDGRLGGPEDIPALDRWLNKAFRPLKRNVADLPSVSLRANETVWNEDGTEPVNGRDSGEIMARYHK